MTDLFEPLAGAWVGRDLLHHDAVDLERFAPLAPPMVRGKRWSTPDQQSPAAPGAGGLRRAYREHRMPRRTLCLTLSPFDLVLPMLHPPLEIDGAGEMQLPSELYGYQVEGVRFLCESRSALLADEMGTGKTVMSTVALRLLFRQGRARSALIVAPLSVLRVWDQHLRDWAPELQVTTVHGGQRRRLTDWRCPAHVYLTTYDVLRSDVLPRKRGDAPNMPLVRRNFDVVLLDEAQNIKNPNSGRTRAVRKLEAGFRWALSGTPVENRLEDLTSLFDFVRPGLLHGEGLTAAAAARAIAPLVKRRTKAEVMKDLPPKTRQEVWLELDPAQKLAYAAAESDTRAELSSLGDKLTRVHVFTSLTRLKQICNFAPGAGDSPKLTALRDQVEQIAGSGQKVLVFTQWIKEGVDKLAPALAPYGVVTFDARLSRTERDAAVDRFRSDPEKHVFLATVKSAGVGLTLTEASYVVHFDHWWNPAWMWQAEDRAHRRGQTLPVNVYSLWMADTVEERVHALLERKGSLHAEVIDGLSESALDELISMDEWLSMFGVPSRR